MNDQDEMFERATETPAFLGCPEHMPENGAHYTPRRLADLAEKVQNRFYNFYGLELHRFAIPGGTVKLIGKRDRGTIPHEIYEIEVDRENGVFPNRAKVLRDGKELFVIEANTCFNRCEKMAVSALNRLLKEQHRQCHKHAKAAKEGK